MHFKPIHFVLAGLFVLSAFLVLMIAAGAGYLYFTEYGTTTTSTTTTSTTSTSSTTTTSTTSTSSTSTTTVTSFYVCNIEYDESKDVDTRCFGKISKEYTTHPIRADITYELVNPVQDYYNGLQVKVAGGKCDYVSSEVRITVGSMETCEIPRNLTAQTNAKKITEP